MGGVQCTGVNVRGERCGRVVRAGSEPPLCVFHRRENKYVAPMKVRCVALKKDGTRCKGWALKTDDAAALTDDAAALTDDAASLTDDRPLCNVHAGRSVAQGVPPDGKRCTAIKRNGERCKGWAMRADDGRWTVDGGVAGKAKQLCDVHAGVSGWEPGAAPVAWPRPDEERCVAVKADGTRCMGWAVADGLCNAHGGRTGFEEGNELAWKHGLYARLTPEEQEAKWTFMEARAEYSVNGVLEPGSEVWWELVAACRLALRGLLSNWNKGVVKKGWGMEVRHAWRVFAGAQVIGQLTMKGKGYKRVKGEWKKRGEFEI